MDYEATSAETNLQPLIPSPLEAGFLDRLEACAEDSWSTLSDSEIHFEASLRALRPVALSESLLDHLERISSSPAHKETPILPFPASKPGWQSGLATAAAIALLGAVTALLVPTTERGAETGIARAIPDSPPGSQASPHNFIPAGYNRGLRETSDAGIVWQAGQPHRVMRVTYMDRATFQNEKGEKMEIEQPRVEYILVPTKVD